jgi:hypothetical protein
MAEKRTCESCKSARSSKLNSTFVCANVCANKEIKKLLEKECPAEGQNFNKYPKKLMNVQYEMASVCSFFKQRKKNLKVKHSANWKKKEVSNG